MLSRLVIKVRVEASLVAVAAQLDTILAGLEPLKDEIAGLVKDLGGIRTILGHRKWYGKKFQATALKWVKILRRSSFSQCFFQEFSEIIHGAKNMILITTHGSK